MSAVHVLLFSSEAWHKGLHGPWNKDNNYYKEMDCNYECKFNDAHS